LLKVRQPGRALSREKAQKMREVEARSPTVELIASTKMRDDMAAAPAVEFTAFLKMAMTGNNGFCSSAASMSPARKSTAKIIAKPRVPLIAIPVMMDRGMMTAAFWISSLSYT
jgi:hypothetical protein